MICRQENRRKTGRRGEQRKRKKKLMMSSTYVKEYLSHHHLPQLLESLFTGLLYHHPEDPISFLQSCLITTRQLGGPEAVTWDTFIHLERHQLSPGHPKTTPVPPTTPSLLPKETPIPSTIPPIAPPIPPRTPSITPITPTVPPIKPQILQTTPPIPSKTTPIPPIKPQTTQPIPQIIPKIPQASTLIPQTTASIPTLTSPPTHWTIPPTSTVAPLTHSGPHIPSIKLKTSILPPLTPQVSYINNKTPSGPPQTTAELKLLPSVLPRPAVIPPVHTERKEQQDTKTFRTEAHPPGLPPSPARSQLSIDSDSDMTESSGLLQEVSILPPQRSRPLIIFIIGGPGSGKGSQAARLARCFSLRVVSLDELLRRQLLSHASPSKKWKVISQMMGHGELGPQEETISELRRQLIGQQEVRGFIVDGFPLDVHQALSFQEQTGSPDLVMLLLCSNETLCCRLQRRATRLGLLGDNSHVLRRRLETFQRDIVSISRYYRQLHLLTQVDADRDEEVVFADLSSVIREKLLLKNSSDPADVPECSSAVPAVPFNIRCDNQ
ncbi:adenylate kinase isoenzyme 5-like [Siniperca chuatsi]|uniref:adenylate kinase isoenzyme 5-like n=1 Tax=Siniperca chuatsi TaxID=119488 RepID=UPI001CE0BF70|nr:adenylate kinase isoenzyme 5-like [Siniperca chuatsi]